MTEIARTGCIVCRKPHPGVENAPGWTYIAGAKPLGAMTCSDTCLKVAVDRYKRTGRVDQRDTRTL